MALFNITKSTQAEYSSSLDLTTKRQASEALASNKGLHVVSGRNGVVVAVNNALTWSNLLAYQAAQDVVSNARSMQILRGEKSAADVTAIKSDATRKRVYVGSDIYKDKATSVKDEDRVNTDDLLDLKEQELGLNPDEPNPLDVTEAEAQYGLAKEVATATARKRSRKPAKKEASVKETTQEEKDAQREAFDKIRAGIVE